MSLAPWRLVSASAPGTSHQISGAPCQDSAGNLLIETSEGAVLVAVICDGAGSAAYSEQGSRLVADGIVSVITRFLSDGGKVEAITRDIASMWVSQVGQAINQQAQEQRRDPRDYACTLLAAVIANGAAAFLQIGDGAIVVSEGGNDWSWVFWPQHGQFVNTTNFVTSPDALEVMEFGLNARPIEELAMFSDGIENLVLNNVSRTVHAAFFDAAFPPVRNSPPGLNEKLSSDLKAYLQSPRITERTDDDITLILATRRLAFANSGADEQAF